MPRLAEGYVAVVEEGVKETESDARLPPRVEWMTGRGRQARALSACAGWTGSGQVGCCEPETAFCFAMTMAGVVVGQRHIAIASLPLPGR